MALSDPQSVTLSGTATSLPRVTSGEARSRYSKDDGLLDLQVSHTATGKRKVDTLSLRQSKIVPNPLVAGVSQPEWFQVSISWSKPANGTITPAELKALSDAAIAYAAAGSGSVVTKIIGGEH
jgi:hypothetical protein